MREQGSPERALEWEVGPIAEALKMFKAGKIHGFILAKVGWRYSIERVVSVSLQSSSVDNFDLIPTVLLGMFGPVKHV